MGFLITWCRASSRFKIFKYIIESLQSQCQETIDSYYILLNLYFCGFYDSDRQIYLLYQRCKIQRPLNAIFAILATLDAFHHTEGVRPLSTHPTESVQRVLELYVAKGMEVLSETADSRHCW